MKRVRTWQMRCAVVIGVAVCCNGMAIAQLFESPDTIVAYCNDAGIKLRVRVNNGAPHNPNPNYSVDMGVGVAVIRDTPTFEVDPPGHCVRTPASILGKITSRFSADAPNDYYHSKAPKQVPWNSSQLVTLATVDISGICPSECDVTIYIDYFYENDVPNGGDGDDEATYEDDEGNEGGGRALTLVDPLEALQSRSQAVFPIECIENPPAPAQGVGPAEGRTMRAYTTHEIEPGVTRVSFDMTEVPPSSLPAEVLLLFLGRPNEAPLIVGDTTVDDAQFRQTHVMVPVDVLTQYYDGDHLMYFVTNESEEVLFTSDFGPAPHIFVQPQSVVVCEGQSAMLRVVAEGEPPLAYYWFRNGEFYSFGEPSILFSSASEADEGVYQAVIGNSAGTVHSEYARVYVQQPDELPPVIVEPQRVPERWQNPEFQWSRDTDPFNRIDDEIDNGGPGTYDILVNFRRPVGTAAATWLSNYGTIQVVSTYIPTIAVTSVDRDDVYAIAEDPDVAFIERQQQLEYYLDVATQTTKVSSGFYSPDTIADQYGLDGLGVNIAIVDSGVDDPGGPGVTNSDLPSALFFYDTLISVPGVEVNPDDVIGHGTHVAGIALGRGTTNCPPGVAPAAGLIDVRVGNGSGAAVDLLNKLITKRIPWNIGVVNFSLGWGSSTTDGQDTISQHINLLVNAGAVVVCAAGNDGPANSGLKTPAAADAAITVANSQDHGTPDRIGDTLRPSSSRGPRASDGDGVCTDEFKPEIAAPGTSISSALAGSADGSTVKTGTSMACPHVAGVAALLLQAKSTLLPGDVRHALLSTAETRGTPFDPTCDPNWDNGWGQGLLDAYLAAGSVLGGPPSVPQPTNLGFENFSGYVFTSTSIETTTPPKVGVPTQIRAKVKNHGPAVATNVNVEFKIDYITASSGSFYVVGTVTIPSIAVGAEEWAQINWTPQHPSHQCLKAEIMYAPDTNSSDNYAQRNITVANSPVYFRVENLIRPDPILIEFVAEFEDPDAGWEVQITPPSVELAGGEYAIIEALPVPPDGTPEGEQQMIYISSVADGCMLLGGVGVLATMEDCNGNGVDDWFDIQSGTSQDLDGDGTPDECQGPPLCAGDLNCDGVVNFDDIDPFVAALGCPGGDPNCWPAAGVPADCPWLNGDCDGDENVTFDDIDPFVARIGATCP